MADGRKRSMENGKLFGKVSVIDIFAVVLVIALAAMVYFRFTAADDSVGSSRGRDKIIYELKVTPVRSYTSDVLKVGDKVYVAEGDCVGEITDIRSEPATELYSTLDGRVVRMPIENRQCLYLTVEGMGRYLNNGYFLTDDLEIRIYDYIYVYTREVATSGTVISVGLGEDKS